ncbi:unnamed protein product [Rotaria sp. Silwood2]|nr:unnamed protein product [Rotaria sp. Silwood2]CAF2855827.1 unnamed protein product [Rotaria sp. Silwood2]
MDLADITEFRTTWNNEIFLKNKSTFLTAKRLIRKSIIIVQARLCRQLKYAENNLTIELQAIEHEKQILNNYSQSNSLAEHLQQRLKILKNEIDNYNLQIKNIVKKEKEYWKQLEQTISKRTNIHKTTTNNFKPLENSSNAQPIVVVNAAFVMHVDKNNENLPPLEYKSCERDNKSPVKISKIRKKKKCTS